MTIWMLLIARSEGSRGEQKKSHLYHLKAISACFRRLHPNINSRYLLTDDNVITESQGFEPWIGDKPTLVFKTSTFNRSVNSPRIKEYPHSRYKTIKTLNALKIDS